ncbi:MAG: hypothetical protein ACLPKW_00265 [Acetobacteraceae bacterium]|jgi:hypothetical protein
MGRPKFDTPNYRLVQRGQRYHVQWWQDGKPRSVSTGQTDKRQASIWLNRFVAGQGTPEPPAAPTVSQVLDGYLADRKQTVIGYETLMTNTKALKRHLGDLEPDHLTTERTRFYRGVGVPRDMRSVQPTTVETSPFRTARSCANW